MSKLTSNASLLLPLAVAAVLLPAAPAFALPGLDLDADLYGGLKTTGPSALPAGNLDLDLYAGTPLFKASLHTLSLGQLDNVAEAVVRWQIDLPFVAIRPGVGYQANTLFASLATSSQPVGALDNAPYGNLWVTVDPPLLPVSFDAAAGVSYPLGLRQPVVDYLADVNFFPLPLVPVGLTARYRGYSIGTAGSPALSTVELGLRIKL